MPSTTERKPRILLAGVPFGRDNVGDEAILECLVNIVRETRPDAEICASTDDQDASERKLGIRSQPLFGFTPPGFDPEVLRQAIQDCDVLIWSGATGLSDYPDIPLSLLDSAIAQGKRTIIFCTGMNDELNPSLYQLLPGMRRLVFDTIKTLTFGQVDLRKDFETKGLTKTHETMRRVLPQADLIVLRDAPSQSELTKILGDDVKLSVGADPAISLGCPDIDACRFSETTRRFLASPTPKIGLCISTQSPVNRIGDMQTMFDSLISERGIKLVGVPMNPITDAALLNDFRNGLADPDQMHVIEGRYEPDEITAVASKLDVVISSRLHLLILASITLVPIIGIGRESEVSHFTQQFDLPDIGNVNTLDMKKLQAEIVRLLDDRLSFRRTAKTVRYEMLGRLSKAKDLLREQLANLPIGGESDDPTEPSPQCTASE